MAWFVATQAPTRPWSAPNSDLRKSVRHLGPQLAGRHITQPDAATICPNQIPRHICVETKEFVRVSLGAHSGGVIEDQAKESLGLFEETIHFTFFFRQLLASFAQRKVCPNARLNHKR